MTVCASCGVESPDGFKFCGSCGAPLAVAAPAREVRKVVTIVFCDVTGSTALGDRTDPEALRATMLAFYQQMRTMLERHGGTVEKFIGDAVMAVFGVPVAHEDDALRAVRAAWEMHDAVPALGLQARIGVNTGEVVAGEGDSLVTGDAVNIAARLEQGADAGEVLIGNETRRLVRDAVCVEPVAVEAKGKPGRVTAFRLVELDREASGIARRLDTPLIGRLRELALFRQAYDRTVDERSCQLITLLGPAGVGKSRLVAEFLAGVHADVARGRCLDYGEGITFWPVVEVLKRLGAEDTVAAIAEGSVRSNEVFLAVRKRLEAAAQERPLVVVFEDIHRAEPMLLDLLDHVADLSRGVPLLLLCIARPELLEQRPAWAGGKLNSTTLLLEPLGAGESSALLDALGAEDVPDDTRARILETAGGNPLFVEEMLALALEGGDVRAPSTIHALIQARLDRLGAPERAVIERGAVEGELFHRGAVAQLVNGGRVQVDTELVGLVRKELIRPDRPTFPGDDAYRFRHLLIRDAAYDALPKETRAELHLKFAGWLSGHVELVELDEIVGYHLEQAARYRRELGHVDGATEERASLRLAAAGAKAVSRGDLSAADNLLTRALALLPPGHPQRPSLLVQRVAVMESFGTFEPREDLISELEQDDDPAVRMLGTVERLLVRILSTPHAVIEEARRVAPEALALFEARGVETGIARAWNLLFWIDWMGSRARPALASLEKAREHAARAGLGGFEPTSFLFLLAGLMHGPFTPNEVRAAIEPLRSAGPIAEHTVILAEAYLLLLAGRFDESLELVGRAEGLATELGMTTFNHTAIELRAAILLREGRAAKSAAVYRLSVDELRQEGHTSFLSTALIQLGEVLYTAREPGEAEKLAIEGERLGAAEDVLNFALGRALRARVAADRGEHDEALDLAFSAVRHAYETDFASVHAKTHLARAHVLDAAGRADEARADLERACERYELIGDEFEAARTRALLVEL